MFLGVLSGVLACIALVDEGDLRSLLLVGGRRHQRQHMPQRVDSEMGLRAAFFLMAVEPGASAAFESRLQRSAVQNGRRRLSVPLLR